jgi:2-polyprenyl-6-hydroxyphenyl methylase/3-demethylubiquinone-9 3-methyltransferase
MREIDSRELTHEKLGPAQFADALSQYDTGRRLKVLIDEFLPGDTLAGKEVLEVGTGLGFFAEALQRRGARVTAIDIGETLLSEVRARVGCECLKVDALGVAEHFGPARFDVVLSSECIEHTPDPLEALRQMAYVLKPGGYLSVSTPNLVWYPVVRAATLLRLRPFDGFENFSSFGRIRRVMESNGVRVAREKGLHLFPFQLRLPGLSVWCDEHLQPLRGLMINLCVLGRKQAQA